MPADEGRIDHIQGSFARQAYKDGITMQDTRGYNPYKFGMAAWRSSGKYFESALNLASSRLPKNEDTAIGGAARVRCRPR